MASIRCALSALCSDEAVPGRNQYFRFLLMGDFAQVIVGRRNLSDNPIPYR